MEHDIKPDRLIFMSKDRLQQILVDLIIVKEKRVYVGAPNSIIVSNKRINTQKYFSNYMKEERMGTNSHILLY